MDLGGMGKGVGGKWRGGWLIERLKVMVVFVFEIVCKWLLGKITMRFSAVFI